MADREPPTHQHQTPADHRADGQCAVAVLARQSRSSKHSVSENGSQSASFETAGKIE